MDKKGEHQDFPSKFFCLTVSKKIVGETFRVSLISGLEGFHAEEGYVTIFRRIYFVSLYRKTLQRNPSVLCFRKLQVAKKSMDKKGKYQNFP